MDFNDSGASAAGWTIFGISIAACIRWIAIRLIVPRDAVQQKLLDDLRADLYDIKEILVKQDNRIAEHGAKIAYLNGLLNGHDGR